VRVPGPVHALYVRTEPLHGPVMLLAGSTWDWLTLDRIDKIADNLFLLTYMALLGALLVVERRIAHGAWVPGFLERRPRWVFLGSQFFFGGLYSAYVVYYAKSAGFGKAVLYLALLLALLVANELADRRLRGDVLRFALFFFVAFSFLLFFVPVVTGVLIGFITAGLLAMVLTSGIVALVHYGERDLERPSPDGAGLALRTLSVRRAVATHGGVHLGLLFVLFGLGRAGIIPPVPLSLESGGAYHDVARVDGGYQLTWEPGLLGFGSSDKVFRREPGEPVWCFTAIFAPAGMHIAIHHRWQRWDDEEGWETTDRVAWSLSGGRSAGYRGFSRKQHLEAGAWRVIVETESGREIGRVRFDVRDEPHKRPMVQRVY